MHLKKAMLVRRATGDGCEIVEDNVPLGKEYTVDVDSVDLLRHINRAFGVDKMRHCIQTYNPKTFESEGWFVLECLEIQGD
jgi:hypothetical protein